MVLDATAGLGRDAFVLASLGCRVQMVERHPVVAALLEDGLQRAKQDDEIGAWVSERISLLHASSHDALQQLASDPNFTSPDVVYLDPMYPHPENKKKPPWSKKEMRVFQSLVGADNDADALLEPALQLAQKRVVVKRPDYAPWLGNRKPSMAMETKKTGLMLCDCRDEWRIARWPIKPLCSRSEGTPQSDLCFWMKDVISASENNSYFSWSGCG